MSQKLSLLDARAKRSNDREGSSEGSSSSGDSDIDMPSGFTSDSYSDSSSVVVDLHWPSWRLFTRALGLSALHWTGPLAVIRVQTLFGTLLLEAQTLTLHLKDHKPLVLSYQDLADAPAALSLERRDDSIHFAGSVKHFRDLRRALRQLIFDQLLPMTQGVPYTQTHKSIAELDFDASDHESKPAEAKAEQ